MGNSLLENSSMDEEDVKIPENEQSNDFREEYQKLVDELMLRQVELERTNDELRKEKELAESQLQKHIDFYNHAPSGYFTINSEGIILELNQSASKFLGGQVDQLKGKRFNEFLHEDSLHTFGDFLLAVFESPIKVSCKLALRSPYDVPVSVLIEGISLPSGVECLIDMVDISGRMKILYQLAKSEMRYQQLFENLNEGVGIVDLDEIFTYANPAGELIFGVAPGELRNRSLKDFLSAGQFSVIQEESVKRSKGENTRYELDIVTSKGVKKTLLISGSPHYDKNGKRIGTFGMFTDITEKKNDERELQRRLTLELILSEISNDFVHLKREYLDHSVNRALQKIGNFAGVDRSYIFLFTDDGLFCNNTHEWCAEGIEPQIENLKNVPVDIIPWWMDKLKKFETIIIPLVFDLPIEAQSEKEILEAQNVKSLLVIPLLTSDGVIGFWGFDSVSEVKKWQDEDVLLLNTVGEILGNGFSRMKYEEDLIRVNIQLELKVEARTQDLKNLLEFNQGILRAIPDLLFRINKDGVYLDFYSSTNSDTYVPKEDFIGKSIWETLPHELAEISASMIENAFVSSDVVLYEYELLMNGENKFYENRIVAISENDALSIIRDITDRKLTEEGLNTTTQNLSSLIQNLQAGTLFEDEKRHIYMVNQSFCDLFSIPYPPEALVGFDCAVASENSKSMMLDPEGFIDRINEIISRREIVSNDEFTLKDGRVFERDYIPILYNNELIGHLWQYRDISDRKQNERYAILQRNLGFNLAVTTTIDQALTQVIQSTLQIEGIHMAGIYIINPETEELELLVESGLSQTSKEQVLKYCKNSLQYSIVQKGEPVYGFYDEIVKDKALLQNKEIKQLGIMPIRHEEKIIGSINIGSKSEERFKYAAKLSLEMISAQIGGTLARINMENALWLSQRNFHLMFDTIDDFMFILDPEGKIIKTNPVVERRLGYSTEELQGLSVLEVHPPERRQEAAFIVGEMIAGRLETCPVPLYKKNGGIIPVETKVVIGKWDGRDALYGISRDISERIRAEETLRESEARWHFALEGSGDGVWDWNIQNNEMFFSAQWKTMLGYTDSEIGNTFDEWEKRVHPDDLQVCYSDLENHLSGATEVYANEHRILCKDGRYKWILDRGKVVEWTAEGKPSRIIGTHTDITPRKLLEEQLLKTIEKEKELNDLKSRFVATASHEFRTPLASMLMLSDTLISYQQKMDQEKIVARLGKIKDNVLYLTNIVNDVLQLSKMQEGKIGFNPAKEDLVKLCIDLIDGFNTTIFVKGQITFHSAFKSLIVKIDNRLIVQSISNLISNAIKYSTGNSIVEVKLYQQNHEICISVKDSGIGIPEEDQKHLFTPFFRARNSSTIQGNGLGLSIVMESMQMHGGNVLFNSELGLGSTFSLHFPETVVSSLVF